MDGGLGVDECSGGKVVEAFLTLSVQCLRLLMYSS